MASLQHKRGAGYGALTLLSASHRSGGKTVKLFRQMKAFREMGWTWSNTYPNSSARWRRTRHSYCEHKLFSRKPSFTSPQFSSIRERVRAMPLLAARWTHWIQELTLLAGYFCVSIKAQPLRLKQLNARQVAKARWLSVPHDTGLTSGVAPNQITRQKWGGRERCHLGVTEIARVSSGSDEAAILVSSLSIRRAKPSSHSLVLCPPLLLLIGQMGEIIQPRETVARILMAVMGRTWLWIFLHLSLV